MPAQPPPTAAPVPSAGQKRLAPEAEGQNIVIPPDSEESKQNNLRKRTHLPYVDGESEGDEIPEMPGHPAKRPKTEDDGSYDGEKKGSGRKPVMSAL